MDLKDTLINIEKSYPKEFEFLLEDIKFEKEVNQVRIQKNRLEKRKNEMNQIIERELNRVQEIDIEIEKIDNQILSQSNDNHLEKLEDYISKNINGMLGFDKLKSIISNYYNQKNFDLEHEINLKLMNTLNEKLNEMRSEFYQIKNEKIMIKNNLEKTLNDISHASSSKNIVNKAKYENDIKFKTVELEKINHDINLLELNCKKKETLFNKYIILLKNRCKKSKEESYYEMNPAIIIETEFEEKLKEEIIKMIDIDAKLSDEDKIRNKNIIEIYFKDLSERERILQSSFAKKKKFFADKESINNEILRIRENLNKINLDLHSKKKNSNDLELKEKIILEKIDKKNKNISTNLEKLGELEFQNYIKSNDNVLKNMKKIYGNKVLDKVFKAQKQKFLENVILDHSYKKNKVNEYLKNIAELESSSEFLSQRLSEIENEYQIVINYLIKQFKSFNDVINNRKTKIYERQVVEESKKELKVKIEDLVQKQFVEIENEKRHLENKYNISFFMEKINEIKCKVDSNVAIKNRLIAEYDEFRSSIQEKEQKLYKEDIELKNTLISMRSRFKNDESNEISPGYESTIKESNTYEESRKVTDYENSKSIYIKEKEFQNKVYVEEINLNDLMDSNVKYLNTDNSVNSNNKTPNKSKKDPLIEVIVEKVKPLALGITLYKRFSQNSSKYSIFDPSNSNTTPENCGYALRIFKLNINEEALEVYNIKNKHLELKIGINQVKGLTIANSSKQIIKNIKDLNKKPNKVIDKRSDNLPFQLLHSGGCLDLVAPNFNELEDFQNAIDELVKQKKSIYAYLKF